MANPGTPPSPCGRPSLGYSAFGKSNCDDILFSPSWEVGHIPEIGVGTTCSCFSSAHGHRYPSPLTPVKKICKSTITFFTFLGIARLVFSYNSQALVRFTLSISTLAWRHSCSQKLLLLLWMKIGRDKWSRSVVGTARKASP